MGIAGEDDLDAPDLGADPNPAAELPRPPDHASNRMGKLRQRNGQRMVMESFQSPSARSVLGEQLSASLRESLIEQMAAINSADEAAAWAHRNLPAKNTLTAADAKMVEERFQARLSAISHCMAPVRSADGLTAPDARAGHSEPPHAVPDQSGVSGASDAGPSQKASMRATRSNLAAMQSVLWAKRFACAIRTTGNSCCDRRALCAAACRRIRIISPLHNRVHSDAE